VSSLKDELAAPDERRWPKGAPDSTAWGRKIAGNRTSGEERGEPLAQPSGRVAGGGESRGDEPAHEVAQAHVRRAAKRRDDLGIGDRGARAVEIAGRDQPPDFGPEGVDLPLPDEAIAEPLERGGDELTLIAEERVAAAWRDEGLESGSPSNTGAAA
jgi:hypothetical protein